MIFLFSNFLVLTNFLVRKQSIFVVVSDKLEDLKVLRRSPDLLNNVKIGQLQLIMEQILFYHMGNADILVK